MGVRGGFSLLPTELALLKSHLWALERLGKHPALIELALALISLAAMSLAMPAFPLHRCTAAGRAT